jgi:acetyl-CoA carboxylase carboxyl transferase subunit beta
MTLGTVRTAVAAWIRCGACHALVYGKRMSRNLAVCPECGHHSRLTTAERVAQLFDAQTFTPLPAEAVPFDVLGFSDTRPYGERFEQARQETSLGEAVLVGTGRIGGAPVAAAVMDFRFMGASLGSAAGELVTLTAEAAVRDRLPLLLVTASGGARMQEGCLSLMQMAKTSVAVQRHREQGLLSVSLVTDPTYGGVAASFATNTDVVVAEAGSRMGFAGPQVIRQIVREQLPADFQTSAALARTGQVDAVVSRAELRSWLCRLLTVTRGADPAAPPLVPPTVVVRNPAQLARRDAWETVQLARDPRRPTVRDYVARVFDSFVELHGDRVYGDDKAVVAGLATLGGIGVAVIGTEKGHTTADLVAHSWGMPRPEGYRKASRVMALAARLGMPVVTLVDTPGAFPGSDAEQRGQAAAIAQAIQHMSTLETPVVAVVVGEGGSGGALALAAADRVLITECGIFSVISPEGCSTILWKDQHAAPQAARALGLTAASLLEHGIVDGVVPEPTGGTQNDNALAADTLRDAVLETLVPLLSLSGDELVRHRRARFRRFGREAVVTSPPVAKQRLGAEEQAA